MGKFRQCLTELSARDMKMAGYYSLTFLFSKENDICKYSLVSLLFALKIPIFVLLFSQKLHLKACLHLAPKVRTKLNHWFLKK